MMNDGAMGRRKGWGLSYGSVIQQEWRRAHAKGAEDAEGKAGHRLKRIGEDVFAAP